MSYFSAGYNGSVGGRLLGPKMGSSNTL